MEDSPCTVAVDPGTLGTQSARVGLPPKAGVLSEMVYTLTGMITNPLPLIGAANRYIELGRKVVLFVTKDSSAPRKTHRH